ncbi:MAG TPA: carbohydrate ABC transporter permease [Ktedonobacteraceae bacterium]|nr:carbohydrate ABC transporter permease [Ktedonobacteraceae bacterium]
MKRTLSISQIISLLICSIVALFVLLPLFMVVLGSLRTTGELVSAPLSWPRQLHWENYTSILSGDNNFWSYLSNSVIVLVESLALLLAVSCPAAFVLARMVFPGREVVFNTYLLGLLFPAAVALLPLYIVLRNMGLLDSLGGVVLPQTAFFLPTTILILRNFFRAVPNDLEEAASIDGASKIRFFWSILLPLSRPALAVVIMMSTVASWNNFTLPLVILSTPTNMTIPVGALQFQGEYSANWAAMLAFLTLAMIPAIIVYLMAERQIVAGLTAGALKG